MKLSTSKSASSHETSPHALAALVLRLGLAYVFVRFGIEKIVDWHGWAVVVPAAITDQLTLALGMTTAGLFRVFGYAEVLIGTHLAVGFLTRGAAAAATVVLAGAVMVMGTTGIGVRDLGLLCAAVTIALQGAGSWSVDARLEARSAAPAREEACQSR
jgi:uncharacterized membrane protein YphA (DoxX/SURF4 family)